MYVAAAAALLSLVSLLLARRYRRSQTAIENDVQMNAEALEQHLLPLASTSDERFAGEEVALMAYRASRPGIFEDSRVRPGAPERIETRVHGRRFGLAVYAAMVATLMGGVAATAGTGVVVREVTPVTENPGPDPEPEPETGLGKVEGMSLVVGAVAALAGGVGGLLGGIGTYGTWRDSRRAQRATDPSEDDSPDPPEPDSTGGGEPPDARHDGYL
ncbi:hypothetical protein [Streptomyces sp. NPDC021622]|uniref:hypothetical protein n=1 Tax=Streptomyces sp. NPDC021622 TaxID=3155013 RepID=UPI0033E1D95F